MQKAIITLLFVAGSIFSFAQTQKTTTPVVEFTKAELLGFADLKSLLAAVNKGQDYSNMMVRNFNLTTIVTGANTTTSVVSEMGPGGMWSEKQKAMIDQYAKKGTTFTLENIVMIESGKKGILNQPSISFKIKE